MTLWNNPKVEACIKKEIVTICVGTITTTTTTYSTFWNDKKKKTPYILLGTSIFVQNLEHIFPPLLYKLIYHNLLS